MAIAFRTCKRKRWDDFFFQLVKRAGGRGGLCCGLRVAPQTPRTPISVDRDGLSNTHPNADQTGTTKRNSLTVVPVCPPGQAFYRKNQVQRFKGQGGEQDYVLAHWTNRFQLTFRLTIGPKWDKWGRGRGWTGEPQNTEIKEHEYQSSS